MGACRRPPSGQPGKIRGFGRSSPVAALSSPGRSLPNDDAGTLDGGTTFLQQSWQRQSSGIFASDPLFPGALAEAASKEDVNNRYSRPQSAPMPYSKNIAAVGTNRPPSAASRVRGKPQTTHYCGPQNIGEPTLAFGLPRPCGSYGFVERAVHSQGGALWKNVKKPPMRSASQPRLTTRLPAAQAPLPPAREPAPMPLSHTMDAELTQSMHLAQGQRLPSRAQIAMHLGVRVGGRHRPQWGMSAVADFLADQWQQDALDGQAVLQPGEAPAEELPAVDAAWEEPRRGADAAGVEPPLEAVHPPLDLSPVTGKATPRAEPPEVDEVPRAADDSATLAAGPTASEAVEVTGTPLQVQLEEEQVAERAFPNDVGQPQADVVCEEEEEDASTDSIEAVLKYADDVLQDAAEQEAERTQKEKLKKDLQSWKGKTGALKAVLAMRRELGKARKRLDKAKRRAANQQRAQRPSVAGSSMPAGVLAQQTVAMGASRRRTTILVAARGGGGQNAAPTPQQLRELQQTYDKYNTNPEEVEKLKRWESVFTRTQRDGEVHIDDLAKALEMVGFICPQADVVKEVAGQLTQYSTLDFEEFGDFVEAYEVKEHSLVAAAFRRFDSDDSGVLDLQEVSELFASRGITPMPEVITAIGREVGVVDLDQFSLDEVRRIMEELRQTLGFTREEVAKCRETFERYDRDESGDLGVQELVGALGWLGFVQSKDDVDAVLATAGLGECESLQWHEFLGSIRRVKENEIKRVRKLVAYDRVDVSVQVIPVEEVERVLVSLRYFPNSDAVQETLSEACTGKSKTHLSLAEVWRVLELYRSRDGFTQGELDEIKVEFDRVAGSGRTTEINSLYLGRVLRGLGYLTRWEIQQRLVQEVDLDGSGTLDFNEVLKVVRKLREAELVRVQEAYYECLPEGEDRISGDACRRALHQLGFTDISSLWKQEGRAKEGALVLALLAMQQTLSGKGDGLAYNSFATLVIRMMNSKRRALVKNAGFSPGELEQLQTIFKKYDEDGNGVIKNAELRALLADFFPKQIQTSIGRSYLKELMKEIDQDGNEELEFKEFTYLVQQFNIGMEEAYLGKERSAIETAKFSSQEVEAFRDIFLGYDPDNPRPTLAFDEVKTMLGDIVPMGAGHTRQLWQVFEEFSTLEVDEDGTEMRRADFPDYLLLMRSLLGINFAGIATLAL